MTFAAAWASPPRARQNSSAVVDGVSTTGRTVSKSTRIEAMCWRRASPLLQTMHPTDSTDGEPQKV